MIESMTMTFGEKREVSIAITSAGSCQKAFEVTRATFRLLCGDEVEADGLCEIKMIHPTETHLSALILPRRKCATYVLEFNYDIWPEQLTYRCKIRVE